MPSRTGGFTALLLLLPALLAAQPVLLGLTREGGAWNDGVLFAHYTATGITIGEVHFQDEERGRHPVGGLFLAGNGKVYGCTESGGALGQGVLFEWDPFTGVFIRRISFIPTSLGRSPTGELVEVNGKLYGLAKWGGMNDLGTLFEYDLTTHVMVKRADFNGSDLGSNPIGTLVQATNGRLYGLCSAGGANGDGTLFEYDPQTTAVTKRADLNNVQRGRTPVGRLLAASTGHLYGMTTAGGTNGHGVLFRFAPSTNTFTKLHDLEAGTTGSDPTGLLSEGPDGTIHGVNRGGGAGGGSLFTYTSGIGISSFALAPPTQGDVPEGGLLADAGGSFLGMTTLGGLYGDGTLFRYDPISSTHTKLVDLQGPIDGREAHGRLFRSANGHAYGTTRSGGTNDDGVLFGWMDGAYTKLADLASGSTGRHPLPGLTELCLLPVHDDLPPAITLCDGASLSIALNSPNALSVLWFRDGKVVSFGDTLALDSLAVGDGGLYVALLQNDCGTTTSNLMMLMVEWCSSVTEHQDMFGSILYDPVTGMVVVASDVPIEQVELMDAMGRQIMRSTGSAFREVVHTGHLPMGTYLIRARGAGRAITQRVVIIR